MFTFMVVFSWRRLDVNNADYLSLPCVVLNYVTHIKLQIGESQMRRFTAHYSRIRADRKALLFRKCRLCRDKKLKRFMTLSAERLHRRGRKKNKKSLQLQYQMQRGVEGCINSIGEKSGKENFCWNEAVKSEGTIKKK
jgi:hypothetical protein